MSIPTISHPTNRPNFCEVTTPEGTFWFSYRTCIAYQRCDGPIVVRENDWGPTTGKHLNHIDGGRKASRVDGETFQKLLDASFREVVELAS